MKEEKLIALIDKYFSGATSLEEEQTLWHELQHSPSLNPIVEEARAVMSYARMPATGRNGRHRRRSVTLTLRISVAAAVAVAVLVPALTLLHYGSHDSICSTMIACREDNSREVAFDLIASQLEAVSIASEEVSEEVREGLMLISDF